MRIVPVTIRDGGTFHRKEREDERGKKVSENNIVVFIMMLLCGLLYTLVMTGISQLFFKDKANGSIIEVNGVKYGSELLGQQFTDPAHMWGRIMFWMYPPTRMMREIR